MRLTLPNRNRADSVPFIILGVALAFWPVWRWTWSRMTDGSDEPLGLFPLLTLAWLLWQRRESIPGPTPGQIAAASFILAGYTATFHLSYPLIRAGMAVGTLAILFVRAPGTLALSLLLFLSLPIGPSLQFYGGYPLRLLVAETSAQLLQAGGFSVLRDGTALFYAGETILVDAPCSGLKMLWAGLFFAAALAGWRELRAGRTIILMTLTSGILIASNIVRSTLLFFKESHLLKLPDWTHSATGLVVFALAALFILRICLHLERRQIHGC